MLVSMLFNCAGVAVQLCVSLITLLELLHPLMPLGGGPKGQRCTHATQHGATQQRRLFCCVCMLAKASGSLLALLSNPAILSNRTCHLVWFNQNKWHFPSSHRSCSVHKLQVSLPPSLGSIPTLLVWMCQNSFSCDYNVLSQYSLLQILISTVSKLLELLSDAEVYKFERKSIYHLVSTRNNRDGQRLIVIAWTLGAVLLGPIGSYSHTRSGGYQGPCILASQRTYYNVFDFHQKCKSSKLIQ